MAASPSGFLEMVLRVPRLFAAVERPLCRRGNPDLDVSDAVARDAEDFFTQFGGSDLAPQYRSRHPGLRYLAPLAVRLAQAGHRLQIQSAMAEGRFRDLLVQQPDLRQHVLYFGQRRADLDGVRSAAA